MKDVTIALGGNPNSGKTSLFNTLTGAMQHVGNWGGVTVEFKEGTAKHNGSKVKVVDLPGTYSLSAYSLEEKVARDYIIEEKPDAVIDVIDAANLERNLYLALQLIELGVKPVLAFNMWDEVESKGISIDTKELEKLLGVTIVPTIGKNGTGVKELLAKAVEQASSESKESFRFLGKVPKEMEHEIKALASQPALQNNTNYPAKWLAIKLFEKDSQIEEIVKGFSGGDSVLAVRDKAADAIRELLGDDPESLIAEARYGFISGALRQTVKKKAGDRVELSEKIDSVVTHRFWAYPIFIFFMWALFQLTFKIGEYPMGWIEGFCEWLATVANNTMADGNAKDLVVDGIIGGVGGVLVFLPNILILFFGISIMEDTGYMARAAFIMDRVMHKIGLHGKSFIPMVMGLGCSVPAIMAARTLESEKDRVKTILLTPLISCSARLPVYILFAGALFPKHAGNIVFLFQVVFGFGAFFLMGFVFKHTLFRKKEDFPFVMELPPYRLPTLKSVLIHMWQKAEHYLKKMGGVVLVFSVILWFAGAFPKAPQIEETFDAQIETVTANTSLSEEEKEEQVASLESGKISAVMKQTYIGRVGRFFEPLVKPLGFDWRGAVSLITGFVAKEVVVGSMGVLYAVGEEEDEESESLREKIAENFTPLTAFAFMLFVLLYTPCVVALVTVIRELKSIKWSTFSVVYQLALAWTAAFIVYQVGRVLGLG